MKNPLVSVIIPTYNRAHLILRSVNSVLSQTYKNLEVIIVDDNSKDHTKKIIKKIKDPRIIYLFHKENKGGAAARNTGIKKANGEYIAFLDSDDEWLPKKIDEQLKVFLKSDSNLGAVGCGRYLITKSSIKSKTPNENLGFIYDKLLKGEAFPGNGKSLWPGGTPCIMLKKECFTKVGIFDESLLCAQEHDLYIRISKHYTFATVSKLLVKVHYDADKRISTSSYNQIDGKKYFLKKHIKEIPVFSYLKANFYFNIGEALLRQGKVSEAILYLFRAVIAFPYSLKFFAVFMASLTPFREYLIYKRTWLRKKIKTEK